MKIPKRLRPLVEEGFIDEVVRSLMSGKEAAVYLVRCDEDYRVAKVYKAATNRSFQNRATYQEGRSVRNSRRARAMAKKSKYGKQEQEEAWQSAEVDALYKLHAAGVRVPTPYCFLEGALVMELVQDEYGEPAPRLIDVSLTNDEAIAVHDRLIRDVVRMLCAGLIHGDLSEYNVLVDPDGPVIIDLPQVIDAAANQQAAHLLERDLRRLATWLGRFAPSLLGTQYGKEMWALYNKGELKPDTPLTGTFKRSKKKANVAHVLRDIDDARKDAERRLGRELGGGQPASKSKADELPEYEADAPVQSKRGRRRGRGGGGRGQGQGQAQGQGQNQNQGQRQNQGQGRRQQAGSKQQPKGRQPQVQTRGRAPQVQSRGEPPRGDSQPRSGGAKAPPKPAPTKARSQPAPGTLSERQRRRRKRGPAPGPPRAAGSRDRD